MADPGVVVVVSYPDGQSIAYGVFEGSETAGEWVAAQDFPDEVQTEPVRFYAVGTRREWHRAMRRLMPDQS